MDAVLLRNQAGACVRDAAASMFAWSGDPGFDRVGTGRAASARAVG